MRNNSLLAALVGVLFVCGLFIAGLSVRYYFLAKDLQRLEAQVIYINSIRNAGQALANESAEYSRRNAAIVPLLQQYQVLPRQPPQPAAAQPAPKPPAK